MRRAVALCLLLLSIGPSRAQAAVHDVDVTAVARVFLDDLGEHRYRLSAVDRLVPPIANPADVLPERCRPAAAAADTRDAVGSIGIAFECGTALTVDDVITLPWALAGVVVVARWSDGTEASAFFRGEGRVVAIRLGELQAETGSLRRLAGRYVLLGAEHILFGIDHLLFVLGLLLLVHGWGALVKTITAFTVAHSVTLAVAVLGWVPVAPAPMEAVIALSIVLLAREVVVAQQGRQRLVHRRPWLVALLFGLFHGFGFAGALGEIGLRPGDVPFALLFFNIGVEAGQLAFVAALLALHRAAGEIAPTRLPRLRPALGYVLGAVAMLWFFDRVPAIWGP